MLFESLILNDPLLITKDRVFKTFFVYQTFPTFTSWETTSEAPSDT